VNWAEADAGIARTARASTRPTARRNLIGM
jgi:hypothetical protein